MPLAKRLFVLLSAHRQILLVGGLLLGTFLLDLLFLPSTLEDSFITFRYSRHLAQGHGLGAWNIEGARVEGYTTFLWMVTLALGESLGIGCMTLSKILGTAAHLGVCAFFLALSYCRPGANPYTSPLLAENGAPCKLAAIWLGLALPVSWYAGSGMETVPFALLVAVALVSALMPSRGWAIVAGGVSVLLVLMRPEGALIALAIHGFVLYEARRAGAPMWCSAVGIAGAVMSLLFLTGVRLAVFAEVVPNTYYAKCSGATTLRLALGIRYILEWIGMNQALVAGVVLFMACTLRSKAGVSANRWGVFLLALLGVYVAYVIKVGGDNRAAFPYSRHMVHIASVPTLLGTMALVRALPHRPYAWYGVLCLALALTNLGIIATRGPVVNELKRALRGSISPRHAPLPHYITWVSEHSSSDTVIATSMAGALPYTVNSVFIDVLGLNDRNIARKGKMDPRGPVDSKTNMDYVLKCEPDMVEGYISAMGIKAAMPRAKLVIYRRQMCNDMLDHPDFRANYLFVGNGPYDSIDRALFVRRSFWENHPRRSELEVIPVTETSLYD